MCVNADIKRGVELIQRAALRDKTNATALYYTGLNMPANSLSPKPHTDVDILVEQRAICLLYMQTLFVTFPYERAEQLAFSWERGRLVCGITCVFEPILAEKGESLRGDGG